MPDVTFQFTIDGEQWGESQLLRLEYERNLHALHQMRRHGLEITENGKILTDDEIDCLTAEQAWKVSIDTRAKYTGNQIAALYKDSLAHSDEMWRALPFGQNLPMKVSRCAMSVHGVSVQEFMGIMRLMQADERTVLAAHPEHFAGMVAEEHLYGIEPFGMYGTPTLCEVRYTDVSELGPQIQADRDAAYPISMAGRAYLTDGVTEINCPYHQFKPTEDGFEAKLAVYWPEGVPDEVVSGHCLHLAMEFYEGLKIIRDRAGAEVN